LTVFLVESPIFPAVVFLSRKHLDISQSKDRRDNARDQEHRESNLA